MCPCRKTIRLCHFRTKSTKVQVSVISRYTCDNVESLSDVTQTVLSSALKCTYDLSVVVEMCTYRFLLTKNKKSYCCLCIKTCRDVHRNHSNGQDTIINLSYALAAHNLNAAGLNVRKNYAASAIAAIIHLISFPHLD